MTKIPFGSLHCLETTNFGHNGNMLFLVLQVDDLLEGLVSSGSEASLYTFE